MTWLEWAAVATIAVLAAAVLLGALLAFGVIPTDEDIDNGPWFS